ncbi:hypothetical protein BESB_007090 [Besnoitia besnoiti]|uniref:Uncharacterized protein n=1 Tax=Besnoitia besnoiti TaxID=94643 RepID=A0A2A9MIL0_BESBE|nr:hypothetical protein BESB_007090 [Besnoitia besnoiti]PFH38368.1 hypothetical protein BESB_007090 [Besnoitia besnoiti]
MDHCPPEGDCLVCFDELSEENYAEYRMPAQSAGANAAESAEAAQGSVEEGKNTTWFPSKFCVACIEELQASQFKRYCDSVANTTCAREQRSLLERGPPVNLRDRLAFPESDDQEIAALWYAKDKAEHSAKLKDSLEGAARDALWNKLKQFVIVDEEPEPSEEAATKTA